MKKIPPVPVFHGITPRNIEILISPCIVLYNKVISSTHRRDIAAICHNALKLPICICYIRGVQVYRFNLYIYPRVCGNFKFENIHCTVISCLANICFCGWVSTAQAIQLIYVECCCLPAFSSEDCVFCSFV